MNERQTTLRDFLPSDSRAADTAVRRGARNRPHRAVRGLGDFRDVPDRNSEAEAGPPIGSRAL
jgi:hypothetical protein